MSKRKTYSVEKLRDLVNYHIITNGANTEAQKALCALLESVLNDTGNYHGFSWPRVPFELVKSDEFNADHPDYWFRWYY